MFICRSHDGAGVNGRNKIPLFFFLENDRRFFSHCFPKTAKNCFYVFLTYFPKTAEFKKNPPFSKKTAEFFFHCFWKSDRILFKIFCLRFLCKLVIRPPDIFKMSFLSTFTCHNISHHRPLNSNNECSLLNINRLTH